MSELSITPASLTSSVLASTNVQSLSLTQAYAEMSAFRHIIIVNEASDPNPQDQKLFAQLLNSCTLAIGVIVTAIGNKQTSLTPEQQDTMKDLASQVDALKSANPNAGISFIQDATLLYFALESLA